MPINSDKYCHTHLSSQLMMDYIEERCTPLERHTVEKHLLNCELCQDAMDGFESIDASALKTDLASINKELSILKAPKKNKYRFLGIAASLSLLIMSVFLISRFFFSELENENLALEEGREELNDKAAGSPIEKPGNVTSEESIPEMEEPVLKEKAAQVLDNREATKSVQPSMVAESKTPKAVEVENEPMEVIEDSPALAQVMSQRQAGISVTNEIEEESAIDDLDAYEELEIVALMDEELPEVVYEKKRDQAIVDMESDAISSTTVIQPAARIRSMASESSGSVFGKVISDEDHQGIPGVNVYVKDQTQLSTVTDFDGDFKLDLPNDSSVIVYNFIGYETKELLAIPGMQQDVQLRADVNSLSEVVVSGYAKNIQAKREKSVNEEKIIEPKPINGLNRYTKAIQKNLIYPQEALNSSVEGNVVLTFQVGSDGKITNIEVLEGIGYGCDEEAMRLVSEGTDWESGRVDQIPVEMKAIFTVSFVITK